jgi:hypothetical protein
MQCPEPGIYPDTPELEYFRWEAVNQSLLTKVRNGTPKEAWHYKNEPPKETDSQGLGSALHIAMLEPHLWEEKVVEGLDFDRKGKAKQLKHEIFAAENAGKIILRPKEMEQCRAMEERMRGSVLMMEIIEAPGLVEVAVVWDDEETGLRCKARYDGLKTWRGHNVIFDVKSTASALDDKSIDKTIGKWGYDIQAAFYLDGANALSEAERIFIFGFVQSPPKNNPNKYVDCRGVQPDPTCLYEGRHKYKRAMRQWAKCVESGEYPGYGNEIYYASLPKWDQVAEQEMNDDDE